MTNQEFYQIIKDKVTSGSPVERLEAERLFLTSTDAELSELATMQRDRLHPPLEATYLVMAIVNYTNVCVAKCDYCSFYRLPHEKGTYLLSTDEVCDKVAALKQLGGTLVGFNGGFHPKLRIQDYAELFHAVRTRFPDIEFYEMTVAEFMFSCKVSKISYEEGANILKASGTRWVTGGGAEILSNPFRKRHSPGKYTVEDYFTAQRAILDAGLGSTATMVIGFDETLDERFDHLEQLHQFQSSGDRPLASFLCWTYKPQYNTLGQSIQSEISTQEYLRWLAVCRIYLHNIRNIRTSVLTKNSDALLGLAYGANDFDLPTEDEVTQRAGATISHDFEQILNTGRQLGFKLKLRKAWQYDGTLENDSSHDSVCGTYSHSTVGGLSPESSGLV
jgi:cyclic dehypoxanthinyl futalosine synthase